MVRFKLTPQDFEYWRRRAEFGEERYLEISRDMWRDGENIPHVMFSPLQEVTFGTIDNPTKAVVVDLVAMPPYTEYVVELRDGSKAQIAQEQLQLPGSVAEEWSGIRSKPNP